METPILVQGVSKKFRRYHPQRPTTLLEMIVYGLNRLKPAEQFWALRDVSFSISGGNMVGIIGANGAGKSTLLSLIGGVGLPDAGSIQTRGRIGALLFLGAGFHPDLTGRENVYISGVISGLMRREVASRFDEIVAFAELEDFIDSPLRTFSTGMQMRLAFAVAAHIEPDILLVDEVLAVGDLSFQRKCLERITRFKENGCAIVLVSHDLGVVEQLCDEVIWLKDGRILRKGPADVVVPQYKAEMSAETRRRTLKLESTREVAISFDKLRLNENRFGSLEMEIASVKLLNEDGIAVDELASGRPLNIQIEYQAQQPIASPIFSVAISKEDGSVCFDVSTEMAGIVTPAIGEAGQITLRIDRLDLTRGVYFVDVGVYERAWAYAYDYHWHVYPIRVLSAMGGMGILNLPHHWTMHPRLGQ